VSYSLLFQGIIPPQQVNKICSAPVFFRRRTGTYGKKKEQAGRILDLALRVCRNSGGFFVIGLANMSNIVCGLFLQSAGFRQISGG
jgi:hypothetical protein